MVVLADDVDPIELVVCVPAICRKMGIPCVIVKVCPFSTVLPLELSLTTFHYDRVRLDSVKSLDERPRLS